MLRSELVRVSRLSLPLLCDSRKVSCLEEVLLVQAHKRPIVPALITSRHPHPDTLTADMPAASRSEASGQVTLLKHMLMYESRILSGIFVLRDPLTCLSVKSYSFSASMWLRFTWHVCRWLKHLFPQRKLGESASLSDSFGTFPGLDDTPCQIETPFDTYFLVLF